MRTPWRALAACAATLWLAACEPSAAPASTAPGAGRPPRVIQPTAARRGTNSARSAAPVARPPVEGTELAVAEGSRIPNQASPESTQPTPFAIQELTLDAAAASRALASMPETRAFAAGFRPLSSQAQQQALAAQRTQRGLGGVRSARSALLWSPPRAGQVVVVTGDTPQGAVLVAYHPSASGGARLAASYQTRGEHAPILLGTRPDAQGELLFSTCWACAGEGGALRADGDGRVRLLVR